MENLVPSWKINHGMEISKTQVENMMVTITKKTSSFFEHEPKIHSWNVVSIVGPSKFNRSIVQTAQFISSLEFLEYLRIVLKGKPFSF